MAFTSSYEKRLNGQHTHTARDGNKATYDFAVGLHRGGVVTFNISADIMKEIRLMIGDHVDILVDPEDNTGLIKRVPTGGWAVRKYSNSKRYSRVQVTAGDPLPYKKTDHMKVTPVDVTIVDDGLMFTWPPKD